MNNETRKTPSERNQPLTASRSALQSVSEYVAAMTAGDSVQMQALRTPDYALDFVFRDASEGEPSVGDEAQAFWPAWFAGFPEVDYEVTRTIASEAIVVTQWTFTGTHSGPIDPPIFEKRVEPTGRTIRFRGVTVYDMSGGKIQREAVYMDLATLMVELEVAL